MAIEFNGSTGEIQYNHVSAFDSQSSFTIAFRLYPITGGEAYGRWIEQEEADGTQGLLVCQNFTDEQKLLIRFGGSFTVTNNNQLTMNAWNAIWITYSSSVVRLWVNGTEVSSDLTGSGIVGSTTGTTTNNLYIGGSIVAANSAARIAGVAFFPGESLTDTARITAHANGMEPLTLKIKPTVYLPLIRTEQDWVGGAVFSSTTGASVANHPRVAFASLQTDVMTPSAGGGGTTLGTAFGNRGTAFNGGRTFIGVLR